MADHENSSSDEVSRLETALARIAHARLHGPRLQSADAAGPNAAQAELAARLDSLIAEIRGVLKKDFLE